MLVQFGNNWMRKIPRTAKLDEAYCTASSNLASQSEESFSSNYFQIGQHVVVLHRKINSWTLISRR